MKKPATNKRAGFLLALLLLLVMAGCGRQEKTKVVLTTGFSDDEILRLSVRDTDIACNLSKEELSLYTAVTKAKMELVFGTDIWALSNGGYTAADDLRNVSYKGLLDVKMRYLFGLYKGVALSFEEQEYLKSAAHECAGAIIGAASDTEGFFKSADAVESMVYELYAEKALGDLAYEEITKDINIEISDDEARAVSVQWIHTAVREDIEPLYESAKGGEDFFGLMISGSTDPADNKKIRKGEVDTALENVIFSLDRGEISQIVETEGGYYVVKCINTMDREETMAHRRELLMQSKDKAFFEEFEAFEETVTFYENEPAMTLFDARKVPSANVDFEYYYSHRK